MKQIGENNKVKVTVQENYCQNCDELKVNNTIRKYVERVKVSSEYKLFDKGRVMLRIYVIVYEVVKFLLGLEKW